MDFKEMKELLRRSLLPKRYKHSVAVCETADCIASHYKEVDSEKVKLAALLHDCGREVNAKDNIAKCEELGIAVDEVEYHQPILLHAKLGVYYAQHKYGVTDEEILRGILYHTTGCVQMTTLEKIVYLADLLEPTRKFAGINEMRDLVQKDLDATMLKAYAQTINYLLEYNLLIHPNCIEGYNELIIKTGKKR